MQAAIHSHSGTYPIKKCQNREASTNVFRNHTFRGYKINRDGCLGMLYILRLFGMWVPQIIGNFAQGYQKGGRSDFL